MKEVTPEEFQRNLQMPCRHCQHSPHNMEYDYGVHLVRCPFVYPCGKKCICGLKGRPKAKKSNV